MSELIQDELVFLLRSVWAFYMVHFGQYTLLQWLMFFFPFYIFGEFPRYVLPCLLLPLFRVLKIPREHKEAKRRFLATEPLVSVLLVGRNEEQTIAHAIESLLENTYRNFELIVIDDGSEDNMYEVAKAYADRGLVKLFRNSAASGRFGRPSGSNMAFRLSTGEFIVSVDADTTFDRDMIELMIAPFHDPEVGAVAGNLKVRNREESIWARMQAIEYAISITLWKSWLNIVNWNTQASGAIGAFRRTAMEQCGAWSHETAEDADLSLKIKKGGWRLVFVPDAIAFTDVPPTLKRLVNQRNIWDRGFFRTYYRKHPDLMKFWLFAGGNAAQIGQEFLFSVIFPITYMVWLVYMLICHPLLLPFIFVITYVFYTVSTSLIFLIALLFSERRREEWPLLLSVPFFPVYKAMFRSVRFYALALEYFRINQRHGYLPESAWRSTDDW